MMFGGMPDDGWFRRLNEQIQAINRPVNLSGFGAVQQVLGSYGPQLAQIDTMVKAMRMPLSYVSAVQTAALVQNVYSPPIVASVTAASDALAVVGQSAAQAAQRFASFPVSLFESLR